VIEPLLEMNIVKEGKMGKQIRTFTLNEDNEVTKLLMRFYNDLAKILNPYYCIQKQVSNNVETSR
jgi:hypothetical protein